VRSNTFVTHFKAILTIPDIWKKKDLKNNISQGKKQRVFDFVDEAWKMYVDQ
jgi:hypothetical protein